MKQVKLILSVLFFSGMFAVFGAANAIGAGQHPLFGVEVLGTVGVVGAAVGGSRFAEAMIYGPRGAGRPRSNHGP